MESRDLLRWTLSSPVHPVPDVYWNQKGFYNLDAYGEMKDVPTVFLTGKSGLLGTGHLIRAVLRSGGKTGGSQFPELKTCYLQWHCHDPERAFSDSKPTSC